MVRHLTNTVIGKGYDYTVQLIGEDDKPAPPEQQTDEGTEYVRKVQKVVDDFLKRNHWNCSIDPKDTTALAATRERETFRCVKVDGEAFLRFHGQEDGSMIVRPIDASQIRDGETYAPQDGWTYGIQNQMEPFEDVETPLRYAVFWPDAAAKGGEGGSPDDHGTWEDIDAEEIIHLKGPDTPANVKRGLPLFIFDTGNAVDRAAKLQRNASAGAAVRAAIAETWQFDQATQAQISSMAQALAERTINTPNTGGAGVGNQTFVERVFPGMVRRGPTGASLVQPSADNTASYLTGKEGDIQQACAGEGIASFVLGGLESGNYSNFESASYPPVQNATCEQEYYKLAFARVVWKAIQWAVSRGVLPSDVMEKVTLTVEAPAVLHRNELEKAQEDEISVTNGWKDRQTCASERGLDWDQIEANNEDYQKKQNKLMPQPAPGAAGQPGANGKPGTPGKPPMPKTPVREAFDPSEKRDETGEWTSGGGKKRAKASEKQHLYDKTEANASAAYRVMNGLLARRQKGEYSAADAKQDVETYHQRLKAANRAVHRKFLRGLEDQARKEYGDAALQSSEWKAVRSAVKGAHDEMADRLEDMVNVARVHAGSDYVPSHAREELPDLHSEAVHAGHIGFHDIADAVDTFKAKHKAIFYS